MTARRSAIVAGGGIGGLAAAIGLRRAGWTVTVLEQANELREVGAGWSFAPNAVRAADALGVGDEFRAVSVPTEAGATLRVPSGRYLMRFANGRDTPLLANHRADLQRVLLDHLPAEWVHTGAEVTGVEQSDTGVTVTYRTRPGSRQAADMSQAIDGSRQAATNASPQAAADTTRQIVGGMAQQAATNLARQPVGDMPQQDAANASRQAATDPAQPDAADLSFQAAGTSPQAAYVSLQVEADVLIGADGIHSAVRRAVWPDLPAPVFQRILCWRGVTEPGSVWPVGGFQTWGRGARFGAHPLSGQRVFWFLAVRAPEPGMRFDDDLAEVRRRVGGWHEPIPALLSATPPDSLLCHDIADLDPLESYVDRRVALLGDAAHAMTPFLAQGACQALEDAAVLAAVLAGDIPTALARYDQARRPRSQRVRRMARQDPAISLSTSPVVYGLMTGLTRLAGGGVAARKAGRLWDWAPPTLV